MLGVVDVVCDHTCNMRKNVTCIIYVTEASLVPRPRSQRRALLRATQSGNETRLEACENLPMGVYSVGGGHRAVYIQQSGIKLSMKWTSVKVIKRNVSQYWFSRRGVLLVL